MFSAEVIQRKVAKNENPRQQSRSSKFQPPAKRVKQEKQQPVNENQSSSSAMKKHKAREDQVSQNIKDKTSKFDGVKKKAMNTENKTVKKPKSEQESLVMKVKSNQINGVKKKAKNIEKKRLKKQTGARSKIAEQEAQTGGNGNTAVGCATSKKAPFYRESATGVSRSHNSKKAKVAPFYMNGNISETSLDGSDMELKETEDGEKDDGNSGIQDNEARGERRREMVGEPLSVASSTCKKVVYAAVSPGTTLYFQGMLHVKVLAGSVEILGYTMKEGESETVCSLPTMSLLGVKVVEGRKVEAKEPSLLSEGVPDTWLNDLATQQEGNIGVLEFKKYHPREVKFMKTMGWGRLYACPERQDHWSNLEAMLVTPENCHLYRIYEEGPEWRELADTFKVSCNSSKKRPVIVICGAKDVGKSMFLKFITNYILTGQREAGVTYMDCDPGQSELSAPCTICSVRVTKPLLQPAHMNDPKSIGLDKKEILIGDTSPRFCLRRYGAAMETVFSDSRTWPSRCTVINTMGWIESAGYSCLVDILRTTQPTHVVYIKSRMRRIPIRLNQKDIDKSREGIITKAGSRGFHYSLKIIESISPEIGGKNILHPKVLRELHILYELSKFLMRKDDKSFIMQIPWKKIAIHICGEPVPKERLLQAINGQLVVLCHIMPHSFTTLSNDLPKLASISDTAWSFLAWGIIRGIDPITQELHVLTALDHKVAEKRVNAVLLPKIHLPIAVYRYFCPTGAGPYMQESCGTMKLNVGRKIKLKHD
ncbi:hypothetical protein Pcinc_013762 [Petrolisthes cinctipes]|uniref:Polynucleotide 5'-hydroxyl-kinase NOL9 n=1 Tax=Petrolisthes cinctipes TaxID=88211 RepID=A0AAE1KU01_PETCI|nr:hypothetical protein Pcinc_013762 [Petrolisthes cinctipes]